MAKSAGWEWLTDLYFVTVQTFVIQFIILLVVLYVLNRFIFKPYLAYLDEWEAKQEKVKQDYENADAIIAEKTRQGDEILEKARSKGNTIIEESESLAKAKKEKILADAEVQAKDMKTVAEKEIENQKNSMLSDAKSKVLDLALKLNEKLFKDEKVSKDFLEKNIDSIK